MRALRIIADLVVDDIDRARSFYGDYLGLSTEEFNLGWVARFSSPETDAMVQVLTADATGPVNPAISIHVDDVEEAYRQAQANGYEIVHPLTVEPWGVHRFFVRAPDGTVINMVAHAR